MVWNPLRSFPSGRANAIYKTKAKILILTIDQKKIGEKNLETPVSLFYFHKNCNNLEGNEICLSRNWLLILPDASSGELINPAVSLYCKLVPFFFPDGLRLQLIFSFVPQSSLWIGFFKERVWIFPENLKARKLCSLLKFDKVAPASFLSQSEVKIGMLCHVTYYSRRLAKTESMRD